MIKETLEKNKTIQIGDRELAVLKETFPGCFNSDGEFDFTLFRELLGQKADIVDEGYELKFLGKEYARLMAALDTETVIVPDTGHNSLPENKDSRNVYITGDNLDALKHLLKSYQGKVNVIYIDPPYNTGNDNFAYNDRFGYTSEELSEKLDINLEKAKRILELSKKGTTSHSAWLCFMLPRLFLARSLLSEDGAIFISIDSNEQGNLKLLCDEIFGENNFIAQISWKRKGGRQDSRHFAQNSEYILCYAKNSDSFVAGVQLKPQDDYPDFDRKKQRYYKTQLLRKWGDASRKTDREHLFYPITAPDGTEVYPMLEPLGEDEIALFPNSGKEGRWRWEKDTVEKGLKEDLLEFKNNKDGILDVYEKVYQPEEDQPKLTKYSTWIDNIGSGSTELSNLFGFKAFDYPKSSRYVSHLLKMGNAGPNAIVLDFFSGSSTTANGVFEQNLEDGGNRSFIMVQLPEPLKEKSEGLNHGYSTVDQIGRERIRLAAKKIKAEHPDTEVDLGFKHFILEELPQNTLDKIEDFDVNSVRAIADMGDTPTEFDKDTILTTWVNNDGYGLSRSPEEIDLAGYTGYYMKPESGNGGHIYLLDKGLTGEAIDSLICRYEDERFNPETIVLYGYNFTFKETTELKQNLQRLDKNGIDVRVAIETRY